MNRGAPDEYKYTRTTRGLAPSSPRRGRLPSQDSSRTSSFRNQAAMKQDLNIDEFGDMGSDEDDLQALGSNYVPPKPPSHPQYNLVPYGFLRDDDELVEEDYDGVPIDDKGSQDSPKKQSWQSSPLKPPSDEIRGDPITVLGSGNRPESYLPKWQSDTWSQDRVPETRQALGSSVDSNINKTVDRSQQREAGRWDKKREPASNINSGNKNIPSLMGVVVQKSFIRAQDESNPFLQSGNRQTSSLSFVQASDDGNSFIKASNKPSSSGDTESFVRAADDNNLFIKTANKQISSGNAASFIPAKDTINRFHQSTDNTFRRDAKPDTVQVSTPMWAEKGIGSSQNLKGQVLPGQNQIFTAANIANTAPQIDLLQAAALQQALTGLTQLGSQSGLNLLGAQNLLIQASQNPTLVAALVGTGLGSIQPNTFSNATVEALLKSAGTTAVPVTQSNLSVLGNLPRSNVTGNSSSTSSKMPIPDGSGATRYTAPDVSSLVFDPSTGYRFDASTGLHYDANSGYFFNSELKIYLRWDKFTQTYLRVDNPPGVPRFNHATERMSLASESIGQQSSSLSSTPVPKENIRSSNTFTAGGFLKESHPVCSLLKNVPTSSFQKESDTMRPSLSSIPTDFSKPPPPLPQTPFLDSKFLPIGINPSSAAEQKAAALPNFAETSLFNKLRKAKLAQTAQSKPDQKRWGSPDPLLEAQKHAADAGKSDDSVLNLKEILLRSRQFMKQNTGNQLSADDGALGRQTEKGRSRSRSRDKRKIRSRSRSVGRSLRRSRSPGMRRNPDSRLRKIPNSRGSSPNSRGCGRGSLSPGRKKRSTSRSRSPNNRARGKPSPEARRRKSASRGRSPITRARGRAVPSPEARKRRPASRGRSPLGRRGKISKSPDSAQRRPISRGRSPERRRRGQVSISPELRKAIHHSHIPDCSQSPKVKVVLNQSPRGSKVRGPSPGRRNKRSADRALSPEGRAIRRKLSPSNVKSLGGREKRKENIKKDKITELKHISHESRQSSGKNASGSNESKHVSGYKSLSNLRGQGKEKLRDEETLNERGSPRQHKDKSAVTVPTKVDSTIDSGNEKRSHANHRLVSERTFCKSWERKMPDEVSLPLPVKKTDTKKETRLSAKDAKECVDKDDKLKLTNKKHEITDGKQLEEPDEYDFLNETLDDDKESTLVDEYEEILDYQDLEGTSESLAKESASMEIIQPDGLGFRKSLSKESVGSPVIELCLDPNEPTTKTPSSAESNLEIIQSSLVQNNELIEITPEKSDKLEKGAVVASQSEDHTDVLKSKRVVDEGKGGVELHVSGDTEVGKEHEIPKLRISEKEGSSKHDDAPTTHNKTEEFKAEAEAGGEKLTAVNKTSTEIKDAPNNKVVESTSDEHAPEELGPEIMEDEEWNVVDSIDDQEVVNTTYDGAKEATSAEVDKCSSNLKQDGSTELEETSDSSAKLGISSRKVKDSKCNIVHSAEAIKLKCDGKTKELDSQVEEDDVNNDDKVAHVDQAGENNDKSDSLVVKEDGKNDKRHVQGRKEDGNSQVFSSGSEKEEPSLQVRSVSDIEKFLLLSSQEVEAKREQGIDPAASKTEKKSGIFSRLGEKLPTDEAGGEPTAVMELPVETPVPTQGPSNTVTTPVEGKPRTAKAVAASSTLKKSRKADIEDSVGVLFNDDKPTSTVMIGPMNFVEPLKNFQQFTQRYIQLQLQQENVKARKVYVCHEDVTGAPYHYILIMFVSVQTATDWFEKHKGRFRFDEEIFKRLAGNTKQKCIPGVETFLHYTENNWICKVCKKGNFPPRSLCFGCFQHRDPDGFSPVTILEKGQPPWKPSTCVGTPKLKFFVTKEKVLASAPPLDGFDIKRIEMIMDEKMGFPAGICVFEMSNIIDAGKLKKYLKNRDVEAVSVELNEKPNPESATTVASRKTPLRKSMEERLPKLLEADLPFSPDLTHIKPEEREGRKRYPEVPGMRERSPRLPSREVRVPRDRSPSPSRDVRFPRGRSPGPSQDVRAPKGRPPSPSREVRVLRGCSPSPLRSRLPIDHIRSRSPGYRPRTPSPRSVSQGYGGTRRPSPEGRSVREIASRGLTVRGVSPRYDVKHEPCRYRSRERSSGHGTPGYQSPPRYRSRSPVYDDPRRRSPSPRYSSPSPFRPTKPDGRGEWRYPPPDPKYFRFEPKSGLDYDPTTTLYYEPKSCCFYNDDTNVWLEYDPRTGRYFLVR